MARITNREIRERKRNFLRELTESSDPYQATVTTGLPPLRALEALRDLGIVWPTHESEAA